MAYFASCLNFRLNAKRLFCARKWVILPSKACLKFRREPKKAILRTQNPCKNQVNAKNYPNGSFFPYLDQPTTLVDLVNGKPILDGYFWYAESDFHTAF